MEAWDHPAFYALFVLHKMIAPLYYVALLHAVMTLGHPKWYSRAVWVSKFQAV